MSPRLLDPAAGEPGHAARTPVPARGLAARLAAGLSPRGARRLQRLGIPLAALLLVGFFVLLGFPWDRVRDLVALRLGQATGSRVVMRQLGPTLFLLGPGVVARDVVASWPDGRRLELERARVRPAFSLAWLRGRPALGLDLAAPVGRTRGTLVTGPQPRFDGSVRGLDLALLPLQQVLPGASLEGRADLEAALELRPDGPRGELQFVAQEGSLTIPGLPLALPYTTLRGTLQFRDETALELESLVLEGPMLAAQASGSVGRAPRLAMAPLALVLRLQASDASLRPMLASAGLRVGPDGSAEVQISGTPSQPVLR